MALYWCGSRGRWWFQLIHEMDDVCRRHGIEPKFAEMIAAPGRGRLPLAARSGLRDGVGGHRGRRLVAAVGR